MLLGVEDNVEGPIYSEIKDIEKEASEIGPLLQEYTVWNMD